LASRLGLISEALEDLGDSIGANQPYCANRAYALSGQTRRLALQAAHDERVS